MKVRVVALAALIGVAAAAGITRAATGARASSVRPAPAAAAPLPQDFRAVQPANGDLSIGRLTPADIAALSPTIAYARDGELWLYGVGVGGARPLTTDGSERGEWAPQFVDQQTVSFFSEEKLETIRIDGSDRRVVLRFPGIYPRAYGWSRDRTRAAYLFSRFDEKSQRSETVVRQVVVESGKTTETVIHSVIVTDGFCGGGDDPEQVVEYSADGSLLMVHDDSMPDARTLFFIDGDGDLVGKPLNASYPRWLPGEDVKVWARDVESGDWFEYEPVAGRRSEAPLPSRAHRIALSPDGTRVAYDDDRGHTGLFVKSLLTGGVERVARGYARPVWLSDSIIAATVSERCGDCGEEEVWWPKPLTVAFDAARVRTSLPMESTTDVEVLYR